MNSSSGIKKVVAWAGLLAVLGLGVWLVFLWQKQTSPSSAALSTYFTYTEQDLQALKGLKSQNRITPEDLWRWEDKAYEVVGVAKAGTAEA